MAFVNRAIERLSCECRLMDRAVGIAIEKTAQLVLQLPHTFDRLRAQRPGEILIGEPAAAFDRVREVTLDRVAFGECDVVTALDHPRAAALAEQALDDDGDRQRGVGLMRMQRSKQSRSAGAQDEDVGRDTLYLHPPLTPRPCSTLARRACASPRTM